MPIKVNGSGGGSVTLDAGAASATTTLTLPNVSGTVLQSGTAVTVAQGGTGATTLTANNVLLGNGTSALQVVAPGTSGNVLTSDGTTWTSSTPSPGVATAIGQVPFSTNGTTFVATQKITQATAQATTSGTSITFSSIPSWVKRITVMLNAVSTSGTSALLIQVGSGSVSNTGYTCAAGAINGGTGQLSSTIGLLATSSITAAGTQTGLVVLDLIASNTWVSSGTVLYTASAGAIVMVAGVTPALGGALDRVVLTTVNGTDTFDAGSVNIMYE